ncbi:malonyl-CoA O-methyltransferase [Acinetobacter calcoaceticus]|uniref:Malonyl-[acyl-carrier protein] O-methyltransferase n=1 Tax=Acinetobacter calcoaceticus TaxID=471 RepID=A0A4R1XVN3_ACICA|nr:malonyl-CoA O-methyltransferase [Acinetobacter calcoaceticus]
MLSIDTGKVAQRFAQASQSYQAQAVVQKHIAAQLMQHMQQHLSFVELTRVFEIGCGSGNLSHLFMQQFQTKQLLLNDLYPEVQQHFDAQHAITWCIGDIEKINLAQGLDLVMSSSALQWINDIDALLARLHQAIHAEGYLCFSSFGADNLKQIKTLTGRGLDYLSMAQWQDKLSQLGFEVVHLSEAEELIYFEHPLHVLKHLKATGVTATAQQHRWTKQSLQQFYQDYHQFAVTDVQGKLQYPLSYHPIYCIARRVS